MILKYTCELCSYSTIQYFRGQIIGQPHFITGAHQKRVNYRCPRCKISHWQVSQEFSLAERIRLRIYQTLLDTLSKLNLRKTLLPEKNTVDDWFGTTPK